MAKLTLNTIGSRYGSIDALNDNFNAIEQAIENTFSLDGTSPNALETDLDMNSNDILNAGEVSTDTLRINGVLVEPTTGVTAGAAFQTYEFTATAGQTSFSVSPATPYNASIVVIVNGLQLSPAEVNVSGTNVITPALTLGDEVVIRRYTAEPVAAPDASEVNFIQSGVGAVTRTSQDKMRESISVKDFGAVGDGVTDDTVAIQAAITEAETNSTLNTSFGVALGPQEVYFPPGYYKVTSTLNITKRISLVGDRGPEFSTGARVTMMASGDLFRFTAGGGGVSFSIDGLTLTSSVAGTGHLVNVVAGSPGWNSWRIQNCCFKSPQQKSILVHGDDVRIIGNTFDVSGFSGEAIQLGSASNGCSNVIIANNDFFNIPVRPILVVNGRNVIISNNLVSQPALAPTDPNQTTVTFVDAEDSPPVLCQGLTVTGNTMYGVRRIVGLAGTNNVTISNNTSFSAGFAASEVYNAISLTGTNTNLAITGNNIAGSYGPKNFFNMGGTATNVTITGNVFSGTATIGLACGAMTGEVTANQVAGATTEITASDYYALGYVKYTTQGLTFGASMTPNAVLGEYILILATSNIAFTVNTPTNPSNGQEITVQVRNSSGGALGVLTWSAGYRLSTWVQPGNNNSRLITFRYSSGLGVWTEVSRSAADVPI